METNNPNMHPIQFNMPMVGAGSDAFWRGGYTYPSDGCKPVPDTATVVGPITVKGTAVKFDQDKLPLHLLSTEAMNQIAAVLQFGAQKYAEHNWRKGFTWSRPLAAAMRHITAFNNGEDKDHESGLSHLAHAACCIMFLLEFEKTHKHLDDRYKASANV